MIGWFLLLTAPVDIISIFFMIRPRPRSVLVVTLTILSFVFPFGKLIVFDVTVTLSTIPGYLQSEHYVNNNTSDVLLYQKTHCFLENIFQVGPIF